MDKAAGIRRPLAAAHRRPLPPPPYSVALAPPSLPNPKCESCLLCPNCGFSFNVVHLPDHGSIQNKAVGGEIDSPPLVGVEVASDLYRNSGYELVASDGDRGWVPDMEEPFDLGLDVDFSSELHRQRLATPRRPLFQPEKDAEGEGGPSMSPENRNIWEKLGYVPDSEDEHDENYIPTPSRFRLPLHLRPP
ncbi:uncharacterized protein LOC127266019 [Andrographis paniculata]|uniref:uncharacterized protein LOC127266019 n=1 Tax=Andrographis paniculata TaxID=175694 RepID=UPI0021E77164|nr:uncharacterized protein LOC127266019 [Andrographis paniculata]XP_051152048.1 uncharacterized protein LOC127266019 [Andrographis paniculata]